MVYTRTQDVPIGEDSNASIAEATGDEPMYGLLVHSAVRDADGGPRYGDVWTSTEEYDRALDERGPPGGRGGLHRRHGGPLPSVGPIRDLLDVVEVCWPMAGGIVRG